MAEEIRLSKQFIIEEVPKAPPLYVSVYLLIQASGAGVTTADIAQMLDVLESDVCHAWQYWQERGLLSKEQKPQAQKAQAQKNMGFRPTARPDYSPSELAMYLKNDQIKELFQSAERKLGKSLSASDMSTLFGLYDWLGLPLDVIDLLLTYCVENGKRGMRYIEKTAIGWVEDGIDTPEKAAEHLLLRRKGSREIMRAFGQGSRLPSEPEEAYIKKWLLEYQMPLPLVVMACERAILRKGGVNFPYTDGIITDWYKLGVRTEEDVAKQDELFAAKQAQKEQEKQAQKQMQHKPAQRKNRFINYPQREWDYDKIKQMEQDRQNKW